MGNYDDIINLKRPISKHPKMSLYQRSAQFAPFAALTGYEGQVKETARLTDRRIELDEEMKLILDLKIQVIKEMLSDKLMLHGIDIHKQEIYKIETGKRTVVDYELCGFAKVFNIKLEDLVSDYIDKI